MQTFENLSAQFAEFFLQPHFPLEPASLYDPNRYFLELGGKRVRPVLCLMANELFDTIVPDAWKVCTAIELFHNFTLVHDDIMDRAPLRRGMATVHHKYGESTALLAGDVMLVQAYEYLRKIDAKYLVRILALFNRTAREVCEGQQLDMDFEQRDTVSLQEYEHMISLKTSVLLAASLKMGAILGGASQRNQELLYEFGRKVGLAFQVQDDYLDAFGDPQKFGKQVGGDIKANKKTFLLIQALQTTAPDQKAALQQLLLSQADDKVEEVLKIYKSSGVDEWARQLKDDYLDAFGDPQKFGKQVGGDIKANKKTFLLIQALQTTAPDGKAALQQLLLSQADDKVEEVLKIYKSSGVDEWARQLKDDYLRQAMQHLDDVAVVSGRKEPLEQLAHYLVHREH